MSRLALIALVALGQSEPAALAPIAPQPTQVAPQSAVPAATAGPLALQPTRVPSPQTAQPTALGPGPLSPQPAQVRSPNSAPATTVAPGPPAPQPTQATTVAPQPGPTPPRAPGAAPATSLGSLGPGAAPGGREPLALEKEPAVPSRLTAPPLATARPLAPEADLLTLASRGDDGRLWAPHGQGNEQLTIEPLLQKELTDILRLYQTPYAAVVALEPSTGRVLAMAEHSEVDPGLRGLCTQALYPAASIFKLVTAAALLESGVSADVTTCFHGGKRKLTPALLEDSEQDSRCTTMSSAMASSANVVFGKLAQQHLDAPKLAAMAKAWRFNTQVPFPVPTDVSLAGIPEDDFGLAQAGAGFGDVFLSPLHGALLASVAANRGVWRAPVLFECDATAQKTTGERVLSEPAADGIRQMMEETVRSGTARRIFHERGFSLADAAGKTGSLADKKPFRDYTWFVGYAPKNDPKVAVAAVVVNDPYWRIRATWLGREAMRLYLSRAARAPARGTAESAPALPAPEAATH